jgi:ParB-like chromosome segregation protein Spo0J
MEATTKIAEVPSAHTDDDQRTIVQALVDAGPTTSKEAKPLDNLRREAPGITKRNNAYFGDPKVICRRQGFNPRFDFGDIERLAGQIKNKKEKDPQSGGLLFPLSVKRLAKDDPRKAQGFEFELIDGDRRLTATELLMKKGEVFPVGLPIIIVDKDQTELEDLDHMFIANEGKAFLPLEEAVAYQRMRDAGRTVKQICEAVGRKAMHVTAILALQNADDSLKEAVRDGKVSKDMAKNIATNARHDKTKQAELTKEAVAAGKDKTKRRLVTRKIEEAKQEKAERKGHRIPKMRSLSDEELSVIGESVSSVLMKYMEAAEIPVDANLHEWVHKDPELAVAFAFGALQALKAAAGVKVKLT